MGDVGSGFLGFWLAALAVAMHVEGTLDIWIPLILGTIFVADASVTLAVRIASGQKWYDAHRSHAYQRLSRRFGSHLHVTAGVLAVDLLVLLPAAAIACRAPGYAPWMAATLLLVFGAISAGLGAGRLD
jgi:Fuc2NAc and GlcNAc transferase